MKKYCIFLTVFVLTLSLFTGCGCTPRRGTEPMTTPAVTVPATIAPTVPATHPVTEPATTPTHESIPGESGVHGTEGSGAMEGTTPNEENNARSRRVR